jgi:hypothetical protein
MAKFLNTSATNYYLEKLISAARERLIRISDEVRLSAETIAKGDDGAPGALWRPQGRRQALRQAHHIQAREGPRHADWRTQR